MKLDEIAKSLRKDLEKFKQTETFNVSNYAKDIIASIEIAILLSEFAERNNSKIREEDKFWYSGEYQVSREFEDEEWRNIGILYCKLVQTAKQKFW